MAVMKLRCAPAHKTPGRQAESAALSTAKEQRCADARPTERGESDIACLQAGRGIVRWTENTPRDKGRAMRTATNSTVESLSGFCVAYIRRAFSWRPMAIHYIPDRRSDGNRQECVNRNNDERDTSQGVGGQIQRIVRPREEGESQYTRKQQRSRSAKPEAECKEATPSDRVERAKKQETLDADVGVLLNPS